MSFSIDLPETPPRRRRADRTVWAEFAIIVLLIGSALFLLFLFLCSRPAHAQERIEEFYIDPAGQAVLVFDPLANGIDLVRDTHTVWIVDRGVHLCGDPDGTGRYTWLFSDALIIEVQPISPPARAIQKPEQESARNVPDH